MQGLCWGKIVLKLKLVECQMDLLYYEVTYQVNLKRNKPCLSEETHLDCKGGIISTTLWVGALPSIGIEDMVTMRKMCGLTQSNSLCWNV